MIADQAGNPAASVPRVTTIMVTMPTVIWPAVLIYHPLSQPVTPVQSLRGPSNAVLGPSGQLGSW
jgi:hypothetical protein